MQMERTCEMGSWLPSSFAVQRSESGHWSFVAYDQCELSRRGVRRVAVWDEPINASYLPLELTRLLRSRRTTAVEHRARVVSRRADVVGQKACRRSVPQGQINATFQIAVIKQASAPPRPKRGSAPAKSAVRARCESTRKAPGGKVGNSDQRHKRIEC